MTKAEAYEKAWRIAFKNNDFSLADEIYHPEYSAFDFRAGWEVNLDSDKVIVSTYGESFRSGSFKKIFENCEFLCIKRYLKSTMIYPPTYYSSLSAVNYKDGKIITQESVKEELDYDPSEGQDWDWEDCEWLGWEDYTIAEIKSHIPT